MEFASQPSLEAKTPLLFWSMLSLLLFMLAGMVAAVSALVTNVPEPTGGNILKEEKNINQNK